MLKSSIESVEDTYFNPDGLGIDDYVFSITKTEELNTIVQEKIIHQYILPDFSFDYCSEKMTLKTTTWANYFPRKCDSK